MPINALLHLLGTYDKQTDLFKASFSGLYFVEQYLRMMHLTLLFEVQKCLQKTIQNRLRAALGRFWAPRSPLLHCYYLRLLPGGS